MSHRSITTVSPSAVPKPVSLVNPVEMATSAPIANPIAMQQPTISADSLRAQEALTQMQLLAKSVANNVGEHHNQVVSINEQIKSTGDGDSDALARLVSQLFEANQCVQN